MYEVTLHDFHSVVDVTGEGGVLVKRLNHGSQVATTGRLRASSSPPALPLLHSLCRALLPVLMQTRRVSVATGWASSSPGVGGRACFRLSVRHKLQRMFQSRHRRPSMFQTFSRSQAAAYVSVPSMFQSQAAACIVTFVPGLVSRQSCARARLVLVRESRACMRQPRARVCAAPVSTEPTKVPTKAPFYSMIQHAAFVGA
jgi:hypothetical protein